MTGNTRRWLPAAVVVLGVAAMADAARRDTGLDRGVADGLWAAGRPAVALLAVIALIVVASAYAKHRDDGYGVLRRAGTATGLLLAAAAVLTPIGLMFLGRPPDRSQRQPQPDHPTGAGSLTAPLDTGQTLKPIVPHRGWSAYDLIALTVLYLVVAGAVALAVYALIRMLLRKRFSRQALPRIDFQPLSPEIEQLTEAVAAGTEALEYEGDAREAVIACYAAMEQAASAGGGGRRTADTPEEFLGRAIAAQLIPEESARRLTSLFHEARFSQHPIAEGQRDAAREALGVISEHLRRRVEELAAGTAEAKARAAASAPVGGRA